MTVRNIKTREGYEFWDKLCAIPRYGFLLAPDGSRVVKAEGVGCWIDGDAAMQVVDSAQDEVNELRAERDQLRAEGEALRKDLSTASSIANQNADHALRLQVEVERLRNTLNFIRNTRPDHEAMMKWYAAIDAAMAAKEGA